MAMCEAIGTWIDAKQIAESLGISRSGIFNLTRDGRFPTGIKIGLVCRKSRRWNIDEIRAWIEAQKGMKA